MEKTRLIWVDHVKLFACVLVVLGHFFQSMVSAGILAGGDVYRWFIRTIYCFHVPLFFLCSGFLYQKGSAVRSFNDWKANVVKKLVALGVPYLTFSLVTWLLKTVFSSAVNEQVDGLLTCLFVHPLSPYWYLYALFFLFLLTPTFSGAKAARLGLGAALLLKAAQLAGLQTGLYPVDTVLANAVWFVLGMWLCVAEVSEKTGAGKRTGAVLAVLFLVLGVAVYCGDLPWPWLDFLLGLLACAAVLLLMQKVPDGKRNRFLALAEGHTMPIFLMHTIFAAGLRSVLLKIGIDQGVIHLTLGLLISFAGPIVAAEIMKKTRWMEFLLYPGKYIRWK